MSNSIDLDFTEPQAEFFKLTCKYPALVGGFGCLRGSTKILTIDGLIPISDVDKPTLVLSWNQKTNQYQLSPTGGSYIKGKDYLYQVTTTRGEFVASGSHQIFCADGKYRPVSQLVENDELCQEHLSQLLSTLDICQKGFQIDDGHLFRKAVSYLGDYASVARQYGLQLQGVSSTYQSWTPSLSGAQGLHRPSFGMDAQQGTGLTRTHLGQQHDRLSMMGSVSRGELHGEALVNHSASFASGHTLQGSPQYQQFDLTCDYHYIETQVNQNHIYAQDYSIAKTTIVSVKRLESQEYYYDLQVLDTNNYICADGFIHHNSGKSETMTTAAVLDASHSSNAVIALYEPTFDLVTLMLAPRMEAKLQKFGIRYTYNKQDHIIYTSNGQFGDFVFRSMDKPERIIAYESYRAHVDELDTLKQAHAQEVWRKILGRNRQVPDGIPDEYKVKNKNTGKLEAFNRANVYTTPEGYRFVYDRWKKRGGEDYGIVHAPTTSNPFVEDSYIESLREEYPAELAEAYINGQFTNLTTGTVFNAFNRNKHNSNETVQPGEVVYIGCDFNVQRMCFTVYVKRDGGRQWHAVDEGHNLYDTFDVIRVINQRYAHKGHKVIMYPDASGNNRKDSAPKTSIELLREAGFEIRAPKKNPDVRDRIQCTNRAFGDGRLFVNSSRCPNVANCFEQQAYTSKNEPDKDGGHDDQNDASTYLVAYEMPIRKPVFKIDFDFSFR